MADDDTVSVQVEVPVDDKPDTDDGTTAVATDHVIDAAIQSGVAAERTAEDSSDAQVASIVAQGAAAEAEETAQVVLTETQRLEQVSQNLLEVARLQAQAATAPAAETAAEEVLELGDPSELNPVVDIAPENTHFLTKRWNLFGRKKD